MLRCLLFVGLFLPVAVLVIRAQESALEKVGINFELADGSAWDGYRTLLVPDVRGGMRWSVPVAGKIGLQSEGTPLEFQNVYLEPAESQQNLRLDLSGHPD
jgi:hypothetical protein